MTANTMAVPVHIRAAERDLGADDRTYIRGKLGRTLGKFAANIVRVSVRTHDVNGPRGGVDRVCRIKVVLIGLPSVVFEKRDPAMNAAVDGALSGIEQAVVRVVQRRWMKPRRAVVWSNRTDQQTAAPAQATRSSSRLGAGRLSRGVVPN